MKLIALRALPAQVQLCAVLIVLCIAYALKSADAGLNYVDPVLVAWSAIGVYAIRFLRKRIFALVVSAYLYLCAWYLLGLAGSGYQSEDLSLMRIFASQVIFAGVIGVLLSSAAKEAFSDGYWRGRLFDLVAIGLLGGWILFIASEQRYVSYAVREYGAANYLTLSDLLAMLVVVSVTRKHLPSYIKLLWVFLGFLGVMLLGSRGALLALAVSVFFALDMSRKAALARLAALLVLLLLTLALFLTVFDETVTFRVLSLLDLAGDDSLAGRERLLQDFLGKVSDDPRCLLIACFPSLGEYAHNLFSVHQYFGLPGFVGVLIGLVGLFVTVAKGWRPPLPGLLVFSLLQIILFRAWVSFAFPILVAYFAVLWTRPKPRRSLSGVE